MGGVRGSFQARAAAGSRWAGGEPGRGSGPGAERREEGKERDAPRVGMAGASPVGQSFPRGCRGAAPPPSPPAQLPPAAARPPQPVP